MSSRWVLAAVLVCAVAVGPVLAIDLGDPAPALKVKDWVKGKAVNLKEGKGKTVYVVEFWATWCGPCWQSIPHLTELQKKFKDRGVVVIGVSYESTDTVKPFVEKMGKDMDYIVAVDRDEATKKAYMDAFKIDGIPHAFIIDKTGAIVWIGHPMDKMEEALDQILAGKYDLEAAKQAAKINQMAPQYFQLVAKGGKSNLKKAARLGKKVIKYGAKNQDLMNRFGCNSPPARQVS
jgi:peroxiredoxin